VILQWHTPVITNNIYGTLLNPPYWKIPIAGIADIGLMDLLRVNEEFPVPKLDGISLKGDHTLQKHHPFAGQTDGNNVESFRFRGDITPPPTKIERPVTVCRLHAISLNAERNADMTKK
jgi:hypothetical protein